MYKFKIINSNGEIYDSKAELCNRNIVKVTEKYFLS